MQFLYEFFPVLLFFIAFKLYGIYVATTVGILTTFLQVIITRLFFKQWDKKQLITLVVFLIFGSMTLYFHNPIFVKWKPSIVFWVFSLLIIGSQLFTEKTLIQRMMENVIQEKGKSEVPILVWRRLNIAWAVFFLLLGIINLYIAYYYSNETWVNFKFYGLTIAFLIFSMLQAICLSKYLAVTR